MLRKRIHYLGVCKRYRMKGNNICPFCWGTGFVVEEDGSTSICAGCFGTGRV
ncbi:MAG: hypothetical protein Q4D02_05095 [Clostridia bacterium]|nr:hypothetical protein [Clostridia bacterium]